VSLRAVAGVLLVSALAISGCQGAATEPLAASSSLGGSASPGLRVVSPTADSWTTVELRRLQAAPGTAFEGARVPFNGGAELLDPLPAHLWPLPVSAARAQQIANDHGEGDLTCRAGLLTNTQMRKAGQRLIVRRPVWLCFALGVRFPITGPAGSGGVYLANELLWIDAATGHWLYTASAN